MLLQFSVTNHRSIKDTAIISLKASTDKSLVDCLISPDENKQLVPVLALYGANAAGKSNVLHALLLMREMVCGRYAKLLKGEPLPQEPFAFTDQPTQPTSFEAIYFYSGIKYAYGFSFDKSKVLTEYLYHWPNGREALIFSREENSYQFRENIQEQLTLSGRTAENRLYLSSSNEWNCPQTEKAYLWFFEKLTGFMGTEMRLDATHCPPSDKAALKRAVSCMKCCMPTLVSRTSASPAPKKSLSFPHCTPSMPTMALPRASGYHWGRNPLEHSGSSPASGCGLQHWNLGLFWW